MEDDMRLAIGKTRIVLLCGDNAYKIGRFRPLRLLFRFCIIPFSQKRRVHFFEKYGPGLFKAFHRDLFAGLYANRQEYTYYRETDDPRVMPVVGSVCDGWIIVQLRGTAVSRNDVVCNRGSIPHSKELFSSEQFCKHPKTKRIVIVDYGDRATCSLLSKT